VNWAISKGHELALVEQAGLILRKQDGDSYYDRFRGRLMFPICDEQGRVIGFSGRILAGDEKTAKYVNSPETPIFTKSKVFFGLDKTKRAVLEAGMSLFAKAARPDRLLHGRRAKRRRAPGHRFHRRPRPYSQTLRRGGCALL